MFTPVQPTVAGIQILPEDVQTITCHKKEGSWYIGAAHYMVQKGQQALTQIIIITDGFVEWIGKRRKKFTVHLHTLPFQGARLLELDEFCTGPEGGAWYRLAAPGMQGSRRRLWVCDSSLLVFGDLPQRIFFKLVKSRH